MRGNLIKVLATHGNNSLLILCKPRRVESTLSPLFPPPSDELSLVTSPCREWSLRSMISKSDHAFKNSNSDFSASNETTLSEQENARTQ